MGQTTKRDALPTVSRHTLVMTLLEGPDHFNGHCTCDRWAYRTAEWTDLGTKWAWHYIAESERPDDHPLIRKTVKAELEAIDNYGDNCERNCCWEDTVARRVARDAAHQTDACPHCGNCRTCDDPDSPDHEDCICVEVAS